MEMAEREIISQMHQNDCERRKEESIEDGTPCPLYTKQVRICNELKNLIIFDAVGRHFHLSVFIHQFLAHLFLPLFFFLPNVYAQGLRWQWGPIWFNILQPLFFYGMLISYSLCSQSDRNILGFSVFIPFFMFIAHRSLLSLKYATLSPTEYQRFNECKDKKLSECYLSQLMLFSGWLDLDSLVLYFELGAASARIGQPINRIFLLVKNENHSPAAQSLVRYWNAFLRGHNIIDCDSKPAPEMQLLPSGDYAISVYDVCLAVIRRSAEELHEWTTISNRVCSFIVFCIIAVSYLPLFSHGNQIENIEAVSFYLLTSTLVTWTFCRAYFLLLVVALFDAHRFLKMVKILHCMVRGTDLMIGLSLSVNAVVTECSTNMAETRVNAIVAMNERIPYQSVVSNVTSSKDNNAKGKNGGVAAQQRGSAVIGNLSAEHTSCAIIPRITLDFPENALAWAYARVSIQAFGDRFRYRTDLYMILTMLIMLFMMLVDLINLSINDSSGAAFSGAYFIQATICVSVMVVFLIVVSSVGASANEELALQRSTLSARGMKARARLLYRNKTVNEEEDAYDEELLIKQVEYIDSVLDILDVNNELRPYKFLGLTAQRALTMSIATTALSFYSVIVSLYLSKTPTGSLPTGV